MHPAKVVYPQLSALHEAPLKLNSCCYVPPPTIFIMYTQKCIFRKKNEMQEMHPPTKMKYERRTLWRHFTKHAIDKRLEQSLTSKHVTAIKRERILLFEHAILTVEHV